MKSKEALEELQCVLVSNQATKRYSDIFEENLLRPIEKDLDRLESLEKQNELLKKNLKEYQEYIKKGVEEHYKDFMSDYDLLLQEYQELYKRLEVLEILKKWIVVDETYDDLFPYEIKLRNGYVSNRSCLVFTKDDYEKVKEWLESDK